jgi:hypothetical protein
MSKTKMTRRCPYCQSEVEVTNISVREIPGYKNPLTGKNTAMIERLSCAHEYVDGRFNTDSLYFSNPKSTLSPEQDIEMRGTIYRMVPKAKSGLNLMDVLCVLCLVFLAFTVPPLVIVPLIYFIFRMR